MTQETVLITGANRGIGLALAKTYLDKNNKVIATCRNPDTAKELQALHKEHPELLTIEALDVTESASREALKEKLGNTPIDILINNAGIISGSDSLCVEDDDASQTLTTLDEEAWMTVLRTNSIAPVMLSQELLANLENGKSKKIIMISSELGSIEMASDIDCDHMAYNSSKTILNSATKCMALHLQSNGYIVTALSPGWVQTRMGSDHADITSKESASYLVKTITALKEKDSGTFLDKEGQTKPW